MTLQEAGGRPWFANYDEQVPHTIEYEEVPLFHYLDRAATEYPGRTAIVFRNWKMSYKSLQRHAESMAARLIAHGLKRGDRVSIMLPNLPQTILSFWAVLKAGGVVVMTNPLYMETELLHQLNDSGARFMITLDHLWPKLHPLRERLGVEKYFVTRIPDALGLPLNLIYKVKAWRDKLPVQVPYDGKSVLRWRSLTKGSSRANVKPHNVREDLALLQYTGGTTGISKGVMLTHFNLAANVQQCHSMLHTLGKGAKGEVMLGLLPYFHVYGLTVCLLLGTAINATLIPIPRYLPKDMLEAIDKLKPTVFPGAPSVYLSLMQQKDVGNYDLSSINYCVSGSAPMPVDGLRRFTELTKGTIIEGYGLTEASPVTHLNPLHGEKRPGTIGLPFPDTDARVVDGDLGLAPLPPGKNGELILKGPQVMQGYWNRPEDTAETLRDGWLFTGDIATMDEDGYFTIVDRKKDLIICGGYNVYPREIDEVLHEHPKIREAVAVGIPHKSRGESIKAFVVLHDGETMEKSELVGWCRQKLANYKVPKQVEFRSSLPKSTVGKVLRRALRDEEIQKLEKRKA